MMSARNSLAVILVTLLLLSGGAAMHGIIPSQQLTQQANKEFEKDSPALDFRDGDLIFQSSKSGQSLAVQLATRSKWSHMGMLFRVEGQWMVYEAVGPVKYTPLKAWIAHGDGHHYVVKRLVNADEVLDEETLSDLRNAAEAFDGLPYDFYFGWDDDRSYCSELAWKAYKSATGLKIGELATIGDMDLSHPAVQEKLKERYGDAIPMKEQVITPGDVFNSPLLVTVMVE